MQAQVISLRPHERLIEPLHRVTPVGTEVRVRDAVDVRRVEPVDLFDTGIITDHVIWNLRNGRNSHNELPTLGGVGVYHAMRLAVSERDDVPLLLCEEDYVIRDERAFARQLRFLLRHVDTFDVAVFGAMYFEERGRRPAFPEDDSGHYDSWSRHSHMHFFRLHCVLYSPAGRKKLARLLDTPQTNQIDAYLSLLHNLGKIDVITSPDFAKQKLHVSTIQETLGSFSPLSMLAHAPYRTIALVVALVVCTCTIRRTSFRAGRACFRSS